MLPPLRSFQSEFSHILSVIPILKINFIIIIPIIFHIIRYNFYFDKALELSVSQKSMIWLNLIDYYLILNHKGQNTYALASGLISFYFVYNHQKQTKQNKLVDIFMILLSFLFIRMGNIHLQFFGIRELVFHLLEIIVYYP